MILHFINITSFNSGGILYFEGDLIVSNNDFGLIIQYFLNFFIKENFMILDVSYLQYDENQENFAIYLATHLDVLNNRFVFRS